MVSVRGDKESISKPGLGKLAVVEVAKDISGKPNSSSIRVLSKLRLTRLLCRLLEFNVVPAVGNGPANGAFAFEFGFKGKSERRDASSDSFRLGKCDAERLCGKLRLGGVSLLDEDVKGGRASRVGDARGDLLDRSWGKSAAPMANVSAMAFKALSRSIKTVSFKLSIWL